MLLFLQHLMLLGTRCTTHTLHLFVIHLGPAQSDAGNSVRTEDIQAASNSSVLPETYTTVKANYVFVLLRAASCFSPSESANEVSYETQ